MYQLKLWWKLYNNGNIFMFNRKKPDMIPRIKQNPRWTETRGTRKWKYLCQDDRTMRYML